VGDGHIGLDEPAYLIEVGLAPRCRSLVLAKVLGP
jgi:hypothetical protein